MVLNTFVLGGKTLHTCAIRPAGIYGEGEQRHLPRIVVGHMFKSSDPALLCTK